MMTIDRNGLRPWCGAALLVSLAACGGGDDDGLRPTEDDRDGDGLSNVEEAYLGSNPDAADTDRDGWNDGDEVEQNTDPLNGFDHPYTGGWAIAPCRGDLQGNGNGVGNVAYNFSLMDQHGEPVRLHDFCDRSIVLASGAEWCEPCIREATFLANKFNEYRDDGLMVITLLGEDVYNVTPAQSNLETGRHVRHLASGAARHVVLGHRHLHGRQRGVAAGQSADWPRRRDPRDQPDGGHRGRHPVAPRPVGRGRHGTSQAFSAS